jgi:hypothetical protein
MNTKRNLETIAWYAARTGELPQDIHGTVFVTLHERVPELTWAEYIAALDELTDNLLARVADQHR